MGVCNQHSSAFHVCSQAIWENNLPCVFPAEFFCAQSFTGVTGPQLLAIQVKHSGLSLEEVGFDSDIKRLVKYPEPSWTQD